MKRMLSKLLATEVSSELQHEIALRKRLEHALRESQAAHTSLVESLPLNVFRKDLAGKFVFANQRCCDTLGITLSEIVGKTDFDIFPAELAQKFKEDDLHVIGDGATVEKEEEVRQADGSTIWVQTLKEIGRAHV